MKAIFYFSFDNKGQVRETGSLWGSNRNNETLFWGAPKSLQMVIAAMKLKDACSLEEKL